MKPIVTLTVNPSIDASSQADEVRPVRKIRTFGDRWDPGGGGINVARVVGELGGGSLAVYLAGGLPGQALNRMVDRIDLPRSTVSIRGTTRISHTVFDRSTRQEYRFVPEGPKISQAELRACLELLERLDTDYLVVSGSLPASVPATFYAEVARLAKRRAMRMVLDTSGEPLCAAVAEGVYLVKPNLRELAVLAGGALRTRQEQYAAAKALIDRRGAELVAVSLGAEGAFMVDDRTCHERAAPDVEPKSAVGAGDSFVAALTFALATGRDIRDALALAVAAGSAAVMTMGTELCRRDDIERLYRQLTLRDGG